MALKARARQAVGYFNLDNGSGKIRGVYLQGNEAMRPLFEQWLAPFRDLGVTTITIRDTGGTDHLSFTRVGLPGFQFIQDPLDYGTLTHHTSADTYDHAVPADLMQASAVIASMVYEAANRAERLPRREMPKAAPEPRRVARPEIMSGVDPTRRFSNRVADYVRYRPAYPDALLTALQGEAGLSSVSIVADIGSGTGISTELLLRIGCTVFAIEPNAHMRSAAETRLGSEPRFRSVAARAEATTLSDGSVDAVTAGQAFHWFSTPETRTEFIRILRPGGTVALFWNTRRSAGTPFLSADQRLLQDFGTDYAQVDHRKVDTSILRTFFGGPYQSRVFFNAQTFDFDGLARTPAVLVCTRRVPRTPTMRQWSLRFGGCSTSISRMGVCAWSTTRSCSLAASRDAYDGSEG